MFHTTRATHILRTAFFLLAVLILSKATLADSGRTGSVSEHVLAQQILKASNVTGGFVVHLGCNDGKLTAALYANGRFLVHGLDTDADNILAARQSIQSLGLYGPVSVEQLGSQRLPYVDNVVNLLVVSRSLGVARTEFQRVLCPGGITVTLDEQHGIRDTFRKPRPQEIDQWTHYLHGPDNNAVANDTVVGPPNGLQWVGGPRWSRAHSTVNGFSCMVSSGSRLFTIEDRAPIELPLLPGQYTLVARDAFNGLVLWKRPLENWENITHWMKPTPVQLSRRLVAIGERVYATLGILAPVTALDAATGEILKVYQGTEKTQEIVSAEGTLYTVSGDPMNPYGVNVGNSYYRPQYAAYGAEHYSPLRPPKKNAQCSLVAVDVASGAILWRKSGQETAGYQATTLAVRGERLAYSTDSDVVYADRSDGHVIWKTPCPVRMKPKTNLHPGGTSPTLVLLDKTLLRADAQELVVLSTRDGSELWRTPTSLTYHSSPDLFVVGNTVWFYPSTDGYDLMTGKVVAHRRETRDKPMGHDRCYRNKATVNYLINSRSGGADYSKLDGDWSRAYPWVRGTCSLGIMPCNGLLYASPHACSCVNETKLVGFYALASRRTKNDARPESKSGSRLERGPAFQTARDSQLKPVNSTSDWPTYRQDTSRSAIAQTSLDPQFNQVWSTKIADPTAPVIAAGRVFVASKDAHTVHCLNVADGIERWAYTADGRIDSPPTFDDGRLLFGSADGWVYCLRAETGELIWKFRAAPQERVTVAFGQVESLWPVHGSVLVLNGTAYVVAGRQSFLDGGLYLYGLDVPTGNKKYAARISGPYGEDGESIFDEDHRNQIKGNLSDILVSDGHRIYLRHMAFQLDLSPAEKSQDHLLTVSGFLDDSGHHRSYWTISPRLIYDTNIADNIDGDLLVVDGGKVFGTRISASNRGPEAFDARQRGFILFATTRDPERAAALRERKLADWKRKPNQRNKNVMRNLSWLRKSRSAYVPDWQAGVPVNGKAMLKAGDLLVVAGTPDKFPEDDLYRAVEGRAGGVLAVFSTADGKMLKTSHLKSVPVWDSLAAADGQLFLACKDGTLLCFD